MVCPKTIRRSEPMSFEAFKLRCFSHWPRMASRTGGELPDFCIDNNFWLNSEQNRVVHDVLGGQKLGVSLDCLIDASDVKLWHLNLLHMVLIHDKVLVLQSRCVLCESFDTSTKRAAFQIIDARYVLRIIESKRITHQYQMDLLVILHRHGVDTVDARQERLWVLFEVLMKRW